MATERIQRRIDHLLDEADDAVSHSEWAVVRDRAQNVIALDPDNADALVFLAAADRALNGSQTTQIGAQTRSSQSTPPPAPTLPSSFAAGRYQVKRFLGEGGKKKVYLAHDSLLDRDVAFALIKTDGLDITSRTRITREAQAHLDFGHRRVPRHEDAAVAGAGAAAPGDTEGVAGC